MSQRQAVDIPTERSRLSDLVRKVARFRNTPIVDDDFNAMKHVADSELSSAEEYLKRTGGRLTMEQFWHHQAEWSQSVFGKDSERGPAGPLKHLKKEIDEALTAYQKTADLEVGYSDRSKLLMELADLQFLIFDATRRAGFTHDQFCHALTEKLAINKARTWNKPTTDEPVEHIRVANG